MTITSSTDICNLALDLLSAGTITDISGDSPTEEQCARWYPITRQKLLREHPWNFATKREILSASNTTPDFGYAAAFKVPADFLRLQAVSSDLSVDKETLLPYHAYALEEHNGEGLHILLNEYYGTPDTVRLIYTHDNTTVSQYDPLFIDLLAYDLALNLAYKVTESNTNVERLQQIQKQRAAMAKSIDGQERPPQRIERSRALAARRRKGSTHRNDKIIF